MYQTPAWRDANYSRDEWQVSLRNGAIWAKSVNGSTPETVTLPFRLLPFRMGETPKAVPGTSTFTKESAYRVGDGWILSFNRGEWGGRVFWFSPDGTHHYQISKDQIRVFVPTPQGLFAVQGLGHMGLDMGTLLKLAQNKAGKWEAQSIVDLKAAPYALLIEPDGAFLVVTSNKLLRVRGLPEKTVTPLIQDAFWWGMYPNSLIAAPNGDYYIGMRGGVVRLTKANGSYQIRWLMPPADSADNKARRLAQKKTPPGDYSSSLGIVNPCVKPCSRRNAATGGEMHRCIPAMISSAS